MVAFLDEFALELAASVVASVLLIGGGFLVGKVAERRREGQNLESYPFYPFKVETDGFPAFDIEQYRVAVRHFLKSRDRKAARQLIFIGEQNDVRHRFGEDDLRAYERLFQKYDGASVASDLTAYLANYARIVRLIGESFPALGIEILLHNLADPAHALVALQNNVTGRRIGDGATNLVVDLKRRQHANQDKLNYELEIGERRFKCTTIPIMRDGYGVVGAICINVDTRYLTEHVMQDADKVAEFFRTLCKADMRVDENILSRDEYERALGGKRHFREPMAD